jgi:putative membrane protein
MAASGQMHGIISFLVYFVTASAMTCLFTVIYSRVTPYKEFELIGNGNTAAAFSMGGAILGFAIPLASAIIHSVSLGDMLLWGLIALIVQVLAFTIARIALKGLVEGIQEGIAAKGLFLGMVSVVAGILNAASMSY